MGLHMDVNVAIEKRRAYRSLTSVGITDELIKDLTHHSLLAPSCFNNQPWRFIFVYDKELLKKMHTVLSSGNEWAQKASMIVVVYSRKNYDCVIGEREYYLFDTGMATAFLILRATELGLVAHPIAGYSPKKVKDVLGIPEGRMIITLVIIGVHSAAMSTVLSDKQREAEKTRPPRKPFGEIAQVNGYAEGVM